MLHLIDVVAHAFFNIVGFIMKLAPIGAFGAMAFTIGKYGIGTLLLLGKLMAAFYVDLPDIRPGRARRDRLARRLQLLEFMGYIKEELSSCWARRHRNRCCRA